jgi:hypothetical protein
MKKQTEIVFSKISKEKTNGLTTMVNEAIAIKLLPVRSFTIVDLWNIQRKHYTKITRRKSASFR